MMQQNKRVVGSITEGAAADYLERMGVRILEKNFRCRSGEIDLIGQDGEYLVFFEVKYRSTGKYGTSFEAVSYGKQKQICRVSDFYRLKKGLGENTMLRFDVIGMDGNQIQWIKNAFMYQAYR